MLLLLGFNRSHYDKSAAWTECAAHRTPWIQQLVSHKSSIWYSTAYPQGLNGMVQYCTKTDKIKSVIKYPSHIRCKYHSVCKSDSSSTIYIVDGCRGEIISFCLSTKQFTKIKSIPKVGAFCTSIVVQNRIYIFGGDCNHKSMMIYSIQNGTVQIIKDEATSRKMESIAVLQYRGKLMRFGGLLSQTKRNSDQFWMSSIPPRKSPNTQINWTQQREFSLKTPLSFSGYVLYRHYIITFGGYSNRKTCSDRIFTLNLLDNEGWKEVNHIRCPMASCYQAVIVGEDQGTPTVHLFTGNNTKNSIKHWKVSMKEIITVEQDEIGDGNGFHFNGTHHGVQSMHSLHSLSPLQCGECTNCQSLKSQVAELKESQKQMKLELERMKQQVQDLKNSNGNHNLCK